MTVVCNFGNTTLATASGFYRAEAYNIGTTSTTKLALSTPRSIAVTFANAGDLKKVIVAIESTTPGSTATLSGMKDVTVTLKESGVTRASVTRTPTQIFNGLDYNATLLTTFHSPGWIVPFTGFNYTVTTAPGVWTLEVSQSGAPSGGYDIRTSDATNPFYVAVCNNLVTFASNDCVVCDAEAGTVTIDATATFKGVFPTGSAVTSVCAIVTKAATGAVASVSGFIWENPAAASYTLTIDGMVVISAHGGFRVGTSAAPIALAQAGTINIIPATSGTATTSGFCEVQSLVTTSGGSAAKSNFFCYGEVPATRNTTLSTALAAGGTATMTIASPTVVSRTAHGLAVDQPISFYTTGALPTGITAYATYYVISTGFGANSFQISTSIGGAAVNTSGSQSGTHSLNPIIQTTATTGWAVNDIISLGGSTTKGTVDTTAYVIQAISGTLITPTVFIANTRSALGKVVRLNGYGMKINITKLSGGLMSSTGQSSCIIEGTQITMSGTGANISLFGNTANTGSNGWGEGDTTANIGGFIFRNMSIRWGGGSNTGGYLDQSFMTRKFGCTAINCDIVNGHIAVIPTQAIDNATGHTITGCNVIQLNSFLNAGNSAVRSFTITNNTFDTQISNSSNPFIAVQGGGGTFTGNRFWGSAANGSGSNLSGAALLVSNVFNPVAWSGNTFENNTIGVHFQGASHVGIIDSNSIFGAEVANTTDVRITGTGLFLDYEFYSPTGNINMSTTNLSASAAGSTVRFSDYNNTSNYDFVYTPTGYFTRTGYALADTTVRTSGTTFGAASAGDFAIRFQSTSGTSELAWSQAVPTGDITGRTMSVNVWVKINNAAYYAGTNQLPRLTVTYDNGTVAYAQAAASTTGQLLSVPIVPTTSYGQITVKLSTMTDATTTNAYVYFDDISVQYPAGYSFDLGGMDLWANAFPVTPSIATLSNVGQVWDELTASHTVAGSFGELEAQTNVEAKNFLASE
jgi:hypothetical protein